MAGDFGGERGGMGIDMGVGGEVLGMFHVIGGQDLLKKPVFGSRDNLPWQFAAARFVESSLRALDGDTDVYECSFVQSELTELPFFASRIKLGKQGVEAVISSDRQGLTEYVGGLLWKL
ncbi:malate dehydrogenase, chloroplastic [Tanacetum coccineum]